MAALERREEEKKEKQATTDIYDLKDYKINLSGSGGSRLLLFSASAEGTPDAIAALEQKEPQIRDAVILLASDYTVLELEPLDGKLS